jgi:hypothetical protein
LRRKEARLHTQIERRKQAEEPVYNYAPVILPEPEPQAPELPAEAAPARGIWGSFKEVIAKEPVKVVRRAPKPRPASDEDEEEYKGTQITLGQMLGL